MHVLAAVDSSGSMGQVADDVIGGFNSYMKGLSEDADSAYFVTLVFFDHIVVPVCDNKPLSAVPTLNEENYRPRGMTALFDAVGWLITSFDAYQNESETLNLSGAKPLVIVHTDGEENSSRTWSLESLNALIEAKTQLGWTFIFLGAGPEAWAQGQQLSMHSTDTVRSPGGTRGTYEGLVASTKGMSAGTMSPEEAAVTIRKFSVRGDADGK